MSDVQLRWRPFVLLEALEIGLAKVGDEAAKGQGRLEGNQPKPKEPLAEWEKGKLCPEERRPD
jgi:hypothetical protein